MQQHGLKQFDQVGRCRFREVDAEHGAADGQGIHPRDERLGCHHRHVYSLTVDECPEQQLSDLCVFANDLGRHGVLYNVHLAMRNEVARVAAGRLQFETCELPVCSLHHHVSCHCRNEFGVKPQASGCSVIVLIPIFRKYYNSEGAAQDISYRASRASRKRLQMPKFSQSYLGLQLDVQEKQH